MKNLDEWDFFSCSMYLVLLVIRSLRDFLHFQVRLSILVFRLNLLNLLIFKKFDYSLIINYFFDFESNMNYKKKVIWILKNLIEFYINQTVILIDFVEVTFISAISFLTRWSRWPIISITSLEKILIYVLQCVTESDGYFL